MSIGREVRRISAPRLERLVERWEAKGTPWHFHMINDGCFLQSWVGLPGASVLVEAGSTDDLLVVNTVQRNMRLGESLARRAHREVFSDRPGGQPIYSYEGPGQDWLARMDELNEEGLPWHHHMFMPHCVLNEKEPLWQMIFEDPSALVCRRVSSFLRSH